MESLFAASADAKEEQVKSYKENLKTQKEKNKAQTEEIAALIKQVNDG